jgi:outer membrane protein OmpA-like peptidoglycan-associated protein
MEKRSKLLAAVATCTLLTCGALFARVEPTMHPFPAGQSVKVQGVIVSRDGDMLKIRTSDDSIGVVDLQKDTKVELKKGWFGRKSAMDATALTPGLQVEAQGKGNEKGELMADRVLFDPNSMRASRQIDTRVSPLEARTGGLENRAGQMEHRQGDLEDQEHQTQQQVGQVKDQVGQVKDQVGQVKVEADQANQGVSTVNTRVSNLDNYTQSDKKTVYFKIGSAVLSPDDKQTLDAIAQEAQNQRAYIIEVAGFADPTGTANFNQVLSERRAQAVMTYLEEQGNIPIRRILTPAGLGTTHQVNDNRTAQDRKQNRRVDVTMYVNQGVVASNDTGRAPGGESK